MEIQDIIWLDVFVEKIWRKHRVRTEEVEEMVKLNPVVRFIEKGDVRGEDIYAVLGTTEVGRYLIAFFIRKPGNRALVVSARDMSRKERRLYEKK